MHKLILIIVLLTVTASANAGCNLVVGYGCADKNGDATVVKRVGNTTVARTKNIYTKQRKKTVTTAPTWYKKKQYKY